MKKNAGKFKIMLTGQAISSVGTPFRNTSLKDSKRDGNSRKKI
jgi:hypothetical protein